MRNDDIRTHRARMPTRTRSFLPTSRTRARQKIAISPAISLRIARAREGLCSSTHAHARARTDRTRGRQNRFVTSTQARARPEFREQYARPREGGEFLEPIKRSRRDSSIVISLFSVSVKSGGAMGAAELSFRYFETHRARVCAYARENRRGAGPAVMSDIARMHEARVFSVHKKGSWASLGRRAGHA